MGRYEEAVLALGPTGYWPLDPWSGSTIPDRSPVRVNGTISGSAGIEGRSPIQSGEAPVSGRFSGGLVEIPDHAAHRPPQVTVAAWVYPEAANGDRGIMVKSDSGSLSNGWGLYVRSNGTTTWYVNSYNSGSTVAILGTLEQFRWNFLVGTFAPGQVLGYVDGVLVAHNTDTTPPSSTQTIRIGQYPSNPAGYTGRIAHCAIFPRALPATDIARLHRIGRGNPGRFDPMGIAA